MKTITDAEAAGWLERMTPDTMRKLLQEFHALKQGLCAQTLGVPTGADDWVERAIEAARRGKLSENRLRRMIYEIELECSRARDDVRETTCANCRGSGQLGENSCCICRGTGLRALS